MAQRAIALVVAALILPSAAYAQPPSAETNLAAGISQVRDGDFLRAVFSLNEVVSQLSGRPESSAVLARTHVYRAAAYIGLDQPERAMAAALLALKANPAVVVKAPEFSPAVVKLFADPGGFAAANPAAKPAEIAPRAAPAVVVPAVSPTATIYVYRPGHYVGSATKAKVLCDGQTVAELQNGRFFTLKATPGPHSLKLGNKEMPLVADGGRDYYIEVGVAGFGWKAKLMNAESAAGEIRENKMKPNDPGRTFGTECAAGSVPETPKK